MSQTILFHCGSAKTGSTTIQNELWAARSSLREAGYYVCSRFVRAGDVDPLNIAIRDIRFRDLEKGVALGRERVEELFKMNGVHTVILSNESAFGDPFYDGHEGFFSLFHRSMAGIARVFEGFTVVPLFVIRDQARLLPSFYTQRVRQGSVYTDRVFYDRVMAFDLSWVPVIEQLRAVFPNTVVRAYEGLGRDSPLAASLLAGHLPDSCLRSIGPVASKNNSASLRALRLMRLLNLAQQRTKSPLVKRVRPTLLRWIERRVWGRKAALPAAYAEKLAALYEADRRCLFGEG